MSEHTASGTFAIGGDLPVRRLGYGTMRLVGEGAWGEPSDAEDCRRVLRREEVWVSEAALKADGVKDSEFYPIDIARVFRSLDRIKPHIKAGTTTTRRPSS